MFQNRILKIAKEHGAMSLKLLQNLYTKLITEFVNKIKKKRKKERNRETRTLSMY